LKTYLPHGDIDLTLVGPDISDENLENQVCAILKSEEQRDDSECEVKDVHYVPAEVFQSAILVFFIVTILFFVYNMEYVQFDFKHHYIIFFRFFTSLEAVVHHLFN
jgi:hypothetical protein